MARSCAACYRRGLTRHRPLQSFAAAYAISASLVGTVGTLEPSDARKHPLGTVPVAIRSLTAVVVVIGKLSGWN